MQIAVCMETNIPTMAKQRFKSERKVYYECGKKQALHPSIHLAGKYLRELGFDIGDSIHVSYRPEEIVIKKVPHDLKAKRVRLLEKAQERKTNIDDRTMER